MNPGFLFFLCAFAIAARGDDSPLSEKMEAMGHAFKVIQKQIADPAKKPSTIARISRLKWDAMDARRFLPVMIAGAPQKDRDELAADYKLSMDGLIRHISDLETAVRDGKQDEACTILREIEESRRDGHSTFRKKEEKEEDDD